MNILTSAITDRAIWGHLGTILDKKKQIAKEVPLNGDQEKARRTLRRCASKVWPKHPHYQFPPEEGVNLQV